MDLRPCSCRDDQTSIRSGCKTLKRVLDVAQITHPNREHVHPKRNCHRLYGADLSTA
jgi:hypothetical protein